MSVLFVPCSLFNLSARVVAIKEEFRANQHTDKEKANRCELLLSHSELVQMDRRII
jgi:hypothetical protein